MSAPDTTPERQRKRHRGPIVGIVASVGAALALFLIYVTVVVEDPKAVPVAPLSTTD